MLVFVILWCWRKSCGTNLFCEARKLGGTIDGRPIAEANSCGTNTIVTVTIGQAELHQRPEAVRTDLGWAIVTVTIVTVTVGQAELHQRPEAVFTTPALRAK